MQFTKSIFCSRLSFYSDRKYIFVHAFALIKSYLFAAYDPVYFSAGVNMGIKGYMLPVKKGHSIIFNKVLVNYGNGYNPKTGRFSCPSSGIYAFSMNARKWGKVKDEPACVFSLLQNDKEVSRVRLPVGQHEMASNFVIISCKKYDTVYLRTYNGCNIQANHSYNTLSGFRIH